MQGWQHGRTLVVASARRFPRVLACLRAARSPIMFRNPLAQQHGCRAVDADWDMPVSKRQQRLFPLDDCS